MKADKSTFGAFGSKYILIPNLHVYCHKAKRAHMAVEWRISIPMRKYVYYHKSEYNDVLHIPGMRILVIVSINIHTESYFSFDLKML